jgi:uroporphyrinogen III methyltransferase / synthase
MPQAEEALRARDGTKPLSGRRIVVTRPRNQAGALAERIEELGGEVLEFPTIEIQPPEDFEAFDAAVANIESYDWLIFTSVNGVEPFLRRLRLAGKGISVLACLKIGAIGPETAKRLEASGIPCFLVPARYQAEGILDAMTPESMAGKRVLIPRAAEAREVLPESLRRWGATVDLVKAYRTVLPPTDGRPLSGLLEQGKIDVIAFTSSSTVKNFVRLLGGRKLGEIAGRCVLACIGPITAATVKELGGRAGITAREFTVAGLVQAIVEHFDGSGQ